MGTKLLVKSAVDYDAIVAPTGRHGFREQVASMWKKPEWKLKAETRSGEDRASSKLKGNPADQQSAISRC